VVTFAVNIHLNSYKQNKFNLLREQSEGFSKLITEITSSLPPPHLTSTGLPTESMSVLTTHAQQVWERVVSLIGYFDLDPNRALDVILDLFSVHLATHWCFFLALLEQSPWSTKAGLSQEISVKNEIDGDLTMSSVGKYVGKDLDEVLLMAEGVDSPTPSSTPAPHTSSVMAQVLGFKFRHYQVRTSIVPVERMSTEGPTVIHGDGTHSETSLPDCGAFNSRRLHHVGRYLPSCYAYRPRHGRKGTQGVLGFN